MRTNTTDALGKPQSFVTKVEGYERRLDIIEFIAICKVVDANLFDNFKANL